MLVLDAAGDIRHANPAAARLLGRGVAELLGEPFGIPLARENGEKPPEIDIHRPRDPDRRRGIAELRSSRCRWDGEPATLVSLRDVTERTELVVELRARQRRLRRLSGALQQAQLAERLRVAEQVEEAVEQPIRLARAEARAAAARTDDPAAHEAAERIVARLDEALRASARTREQLFPPDLEDGGLVDAVRWLAGRFREDRGLRVRVSAEESFDEPDDTRLRRFLFFAVQELLDNVSRHAGTPDADVEFRCRDEGRWIELEVRDRGVGYATTSPHDPGRSVRRPLRGIGLFHLQETVLHRGGELTISSGPGAGTRVRLSVPADAMRDEADPAELAPLAALSVPGGERTGGRWSPAGDAG